MHELSAFVERTAKRARRHPRLEEALLTERGGAYVAYRLRYLVLRAPLRTALHVMEVFLFAGVIWPEYLPYFLVLRVGPAVINGLLWGALESLRAQVRSHMKRRAPPAARAAIERWLGFGLCVVAALLLLMGAYLHWAPTPFSSFSILDAYAIAVFLRLAMDVLGRIHHAGVFAHRRVYRPVWTLLVTDVLDVGLVALLFGFLGPWAFAPALLATGVIKHVLTFVYTQRTYRALGDLAPRLSRVRPQLLERAEVTDALRYGLANLSGQFDAWVVLALATAVLTTGSDSGMALSALLHMGRPLLAAGTGWSRLFYFDFKRLDIGLSDFLRARFDRLMFRLAWTMGALVAGVLMLAATSLSSFRLPAGVLLVLCLFVFARSLFGLRQLQAFVDGDFPRLQWQTACGLVGLVVVALVPMPPAGSLGLLSGTLLAAVLGQGAVPRSVRWANTEAGIPLPLVVWVAALRARPEPVVIHVATVDRKVASPRHVACTLAEWLGPTGRVAIAPRRHLVWWQTAQSSPAERTGDWTDDGISEERDLAVVSGGALVGHAHGPEAIGGEAALDEARHDGLLPKSLIVLLTDTESHRRARARALLSEHPGSVLVDTRSGSLPELPGVRAPALVQDVLLALRRAAGGEPRTATRGLRLHVLGPDGPLVAVPRP